MYFLSRRELPPRRCESSIARPGELHRSSSSSFGHWLASSTSRMEPRRYRKINVGGYIPCSCATTHTHTRYDRHRRRWGLRMSEQRSVARQQTCCLRTRDYVLQPPDQPLHTITSSLFIEIVLCFGLHAPSLRNSGYDRMHVWLLSGKKSYTHDQMFKLCVILSTRWRAGRAQQSCHVRGLRHRKIVARTSQSSDDEILAYNNKIIMVWDYSSLLIILFDWLVLICCETKIPLARWY
jgi:hypothetical protein